LPVGTNRCRDIRGTIFSQIRSEFFAITWSRSNAGAETRRGVDNQYSSMETILNFRSVDRFEKRAFNIRAALLSVVLLVALAGIACSGNDEEATSVPTSPPQTTVAPTTAPAPTPSGDTTPDESGRGSL
jgi:hypothetical protein